MFIQMEQNKQLKVYAKYLEVQNEQVLSQLEKTLKTRDSLRQEIDRMQSKPNFVEEMIRVKRIQVNQLKQKVSKLWDRLCREQFALIQEQQQNEILRGSVLKLHAQVVQRESWNDNQMRSKVAMKKNSQIQTGQRLKKIDSQKTIVGEQDQKLAQQVIKEQIRNIRTQHTLIKENIRCIQNQYRKTKNDILNVEQLLFQAQQTYSKPMIEAHNSNNKNHPKTKQGISDQLLGRLRQNTDQLSSKITAFRHKLQSMAKSKSSNRLIQKRDQLDLNEGPKSRSRSTLSLNLSALNKNRQPKSDRMIKIESTSSLSLYEIEKLDLKRRIAQLQIEIIKCEEDSSDHFDKVEAKNKELRRTLHRTKAKNWELSSKLQQLIALKKSRNYQQIPIKKPIQGQVSGADLSAFVKCQKQQVERIRILKSKGFDDYRKKDIPLIESLQGSENEFIEQKSSCRNREQRQIQEQERGKKKTKGERAKLGGQKEGGKGSADIIMLIELMKQKNSVLRKEIG